MRSGSGLVENAGKPKYLSVRMYDLEHFDVLKGTIKLLFGRFGNRLQVEVCVARVRGNCAGNVME